MTAAKVKETEELDEALASDDLPEGWVAVSLPEVCEINPRKPAANVVPSGAPVTFVPMPAVDAELGTIARPETRPFSQVRRGYTAFQDGDVIMAKITPCMENGKAAIAHGLQNGLGFGSTEFHVLRPAQAVMAGFVYQFIRQESYRRAAEAEMTGSVGQKRVPVDFLKQTTIPVPPFPEQERIVAKVEELLAEVNKVRSHLEKVPKTLKAFRQSVLAAACSGRLTEDWRNEHPDVESAAHLLQRMKEHRKKDSTTRRQVAETELDTSDLPELPEVWAWVRFGSVMDELRNGISRKPEQEPPGQAILRISSVRSGKVLLDDRRYLRDSGDLLETYRLRDGDLLFTRYNGTLDLLGVCGVVRGLGCETLLYPDKLMRVRFDHLFVLPAYAEIHYGSPRARDRITAKSKSSAGQQGISGADIKAQHFALPPVEEQREIVGRVEALFKLADAIEKRVAAVTKRAEKLTQAILSKAFRGELVPTEAELARREGRPYEPAWELLERIKSEGQKEAASKNTARRQGGRK